MSDNNIQMENLKNALYSQFERCYNSTQNSQLAYKQTSYTLRKVFDSSNPLPNYTSCDELKQYFSNLNKFIETILSDYINELFAMPTENLLSDEISLYNAISSTYQKYGTEHVIGALEAVIMDNDFSHFTRGDQNYRGKLIQSIGNSNKLIGIISDRIVANTVIEKYNEQHQQYDQVSQKLSEKFKNKISNLHLNFHTVNKCREDILAGKQFSLSRADYKVGKDLYASTDMGITRHNQEDSVIILQHPKNPKFKMLVVADGAGGSTYGEKASWAITSALTNWFENLPKEYFYTKNFSNLHTQLTMKLKELDQNLSREYSNEAYSTFVGAIVTEDNTIISNVGDSRAYIYTPQGDLEQLSIDDNFAYKLYQEGKIPDKDAVRFHKQSNIITQAIGLGESVEPNFALVPNDRYQTLMLFSDGITDCLSDSQIKIITQYTPKDLLARTLVEETKKYPSVRNDLNPTNYHNTISASKDNTTVALYDKRNTKDKER